LIGQDGREYSRVVRGQVATDLSSDESHAPYFAPTWRITGNEPYVSEAYRSLATDDWVVSYSMPVGETGDGDAILHLEQNLEKTLDLVAIRPGPKGIRWYVIQDRALTIYDSEQGTSQLVVPSIAAPTTEPFPPFPLSVAVLAAIEDRTASGLLTSVSIGGRIIVAAAQHHRRWTVLAIEEAKP